MLSYLILSVLHDAPLLEDMSDAIARSLSRMEQDPPLLPSLSNCSPELFTHETSNRDKMLTEDARVAELEAKLEESERRLFQAKEELGGVQSVVNGLASQEKEATMKLLDMSTRLAAVQEHAVSQAALASKAVRQLEEKLSLAEKRVAEMEAAREERVGGGQGDGQGDQPEGAERRNIGDEKTAKQGQRGEGTLTVASFEVSSTGEPPKAFDAVLATAEEKASTAILQAEYEVLKEREACAVWQEACTRIAKEKEEAVARMNLSLAEMKAEVDSSRLRMEKAEKISTGLMERLKAAETKLAQMTKRSDSYAEVTQPSSLSSTRIHSSNEFVGSSDANDSYLGERVSSRHVSLTPIRQQQLWLAKLLRQQALADDEEDSDTASDISAGRSVKRPDHSSRTGSFSTIPLAALANARRRLSSGGIRRNSRRSSISEH